MTAGARNQPAQLVGRDRHVGRGEVEQLRCDLGIEGASSIVVPTPSGARKPPSWARRVTHTNQGRPGRSFSSRRRRSADASSIQWDSSIRSSVGPGSARARSSLTVSPSLAPRNRPSSSAVSRGVGHRYVGDHRDERRPREQLGRHHLEGVTDAIDRDLVRRSRPDAQELAGETPEGEVGGRGLVHLRSRTQVRHPTEPVPYLVEQSGFADAGLADDLDVLSFAARGGLARRAGEGRARGHDRGTGVRMRCRAPKTR